MTQDVYADLRNLLDENLNIKSTCELSYHAISNHPNYRLADPNQLALFAMRWETARNMYDPWLVQLSQMIQQIQTYIWDENVNMSCFAVYEDLNAWKIQYCLSCSGIATELTLYVNSLSS